MGRINIDSLLPTPILDHYLSSIEPAYEESDPRSDYLVSISSPLGIEYYFLVKPTRIIDSIVYEALKFNALEYYQSLRKRCAKNHLSFSNDELYEDAKCIEDLLLDLSQELMMWKMQH